MRKDGQKPVDVDGLLKQVFPDDLPVDAEARMAAQFTRFRKEWEKAGKAQDVRASRPRRLSFALTRISLVAASVLLIVLGLSLRPTSSPTALASSLAGLQKATSVSGQVGGGRAMECTVRLDMAGDISSRYVIRWISPEETRVRIILAGEEIVRTIRPQSVDRSVLEFVTRAAEKETRERPQLDAELLPVEDLLTSSRLRRLLDGRWLPAGVERMDGCDWESFSIGKASGEPPSRVTVDTCTFLPMRLEKELDKGGKLEAVFRWAPRGAPGALSRTIPS
jgi:hypothetical protein